MKRKYNETKTDIAKLISFRVTFLRFVSVFRIFSISVSINGIKIFLLMHISVSVNINHTGGRLPERLELLSFLLWADRTATDRLLSVQVSICLSVMLCIVVKMIHPMAKMFEKVNRKCSPGNTILQLSTAYTDHIPYAAKFRKLFIYHISLSWLCDNFLWWKLIG